MTEDRALELLKWFGYNRLTPDGLFYKDIKINVGGRKFMTRFTVDIEFVKEVDDFQLYDSVMVQRALSQLSDRYSLGDDF